MFKNKRGGLAQLIVAIFLVIISIYLFSSYRENIVKPSQQIIESGNKQLMQIDKSINESD